jgi:hypothetical protein
MNSQNAVNSTRDPCHRRAGPPCGARQPGASPGLHSGRSSRGATSGYMSFDRQTKTTNRHKQGGSKDENIM